MKIFHTLPMKALLILLCTLFCFTTCAAWALGCRPLLPAAVINAALLALTVFFNTSFREVQQFCTQRLWFVYAAFAYLVPVLALFLKRERLPQDGGSASHLLKRESPPQGAGRRAPLLSIFKKKEAHAPQRGRGHGRRPPLLSIFKRKEAHAPQRGRGRIEKRARGRGRRDG